MNRRRARGKPHRNNKSKLPERPAKRVKYDPINIDYDEIDPIIENLRDLSRGCDKRVIQDSEILDEISFEGLQGITIPRLFLILDAKFPTLKSTSNEESQSFIWSMVVNKFMNCLNEPKVQAFYYKPNLTDSEASRPESPDKKPFIDKPISLPPQTIKQSSWIGRSLSPVQDGHIMGHCQNYLTRQDITQELIKSAEDEGILMSLYKLESQYGIDNVYLVADQSIRFAAILPAWADPNVDIKLREYCTLELIGKFRTLGTVFPKDKTLGRYRIMLLAKGFIHQFQKTMSSPIEHLLKRFSHVRPQSEGVTVKEKASDIYGDDEEGPILNKYCLDPMILKPGRSVLSSIYDAILNSENGLTQLDLRKNLHMTKSHIRNHLKNLISIKMICSKLSKNSNDMFIVYKPAHKASKKKRIKRELVRPTGVMATWDEADLRAKKIIGHKRSSFSQAEDSLLILCRITSILVEPNLRLSWCVHKRLVRDLLHRELLESHDKTSDSCLRRIKYLKRLPNIIMSINELTAELRDDPDILRLLKTNTPTGSEEKLNRLFMQILKTVRAKLPNLLGIDSIPLTSGSYFGLSYSKRMAINDPKDTSATATAECSDSTKIATINHVNRINSHEDFKTRFELIDCQSLASITRAPTYEKPKNLVDIRFNNVCLVTMAATLSSSFTLDDDSKQICQTLLDKFYSNYHDKMISSVLSKLNKRSLLTRKCSTEQALLYRPRSKMLLKLNQSVSFLLNRHHSSSLMQLAQPIGKSFHLDLSENNEMSSIALLTSFCSMSLFNLNVEVKIPPKVIEIDQGGNQTAQGGPAAPSAPSNPDTFLSDSLIVHPCKVRFYSVENLVGSTTTTTSGAQNREASFKPLERFIEEPNISNLKLSQSQAQEQQTNKPWIVNGYRQRRSSKGKDTFEQIEFSARLWKTLDGQVYMPTLFKLIESLLSWIITFPGIELTLLSKEFGHLVPEEHLLELLELMQDLNFIKKNNINLYKKRVRLFGYKKEENIVEIISYEPTSDCYVRFCQLIDHYPEGQLQV